MKVYVAYTRSTEHVYGVRDGDELTLWCPTGAPIRQILGESVAITTAEEGNAIRVDSGLPAADCGDVMTRIDAYDYLEDDEAVGCPCQVPAPLRRPDVSYDCPLHPDGLERTFLDDALG